MGTKKETPQLEDIRTPQESMRELILQQREYISKLECVIASQKKLLDVVQDMLVKRNGIVFDPRWFNSEF